MASSGGDLPGPQASKGLKLIIKLPTKSQDESHDAKDDVQAAARHTKVKIKQTKASASPAGDDGKAKQEKKMTVKLGKRKESKTGIMKESKAKKAKTSKIRIVGFNSQGEKNATVVRFSNSKVRKKGCGKGNPKKDKPKPDLKEKMKEIVAQIGRQDVNQIFKYPVTEDIAPGYFTIVKKPMDLSKISDKVDNSDYKTWQLFWQDCVTMFTNAMKYNPNDTIFYKEAKHLLEYTALLVKESSDNEIDVSKFVSSHATKAGLEQKSHGGQHKRSHSNMSGSFLSSEHHLSQRMEESADRKDMHKYATNPQALMANQITLAQGSSNNTKNVVANAVARKTSYTVQDNQSSLGLLAKSFNGEGLPFFNGGMHLKMKSINIENYIQSLKDFLGPVPAAASSYLFRKAAERISPGATKRILDQQKAAQHT